MTDQSKYDALFSGVIGQDYELLNLICPLSTQMSQRVGASAGEYAMQANGNLTVVELGGGTGITTLALLTASDSFNILSIDNEPVMQDQAKKHLHKWAQEGKLAFCDDDALTALKNLPTDSVVAHRRLRRSSSGSGSHSTCIVLPGDLFHQPRCESGTGLRDQRKESTCRTSHSG